jgi:hypothetical protein
MSTRTAARTALAVTALLVPAASASARPADPVDTGSYASQDVVTAQPDRIVDGGGTGTITVIVLAGAGLLAGAASGFQGGRVVSRRQAIQH